MAVHCLPLLLILAVVAFESFSLSPKFVAVALAIAMPLSCRGI
jgi:hypothetical protein